MPSSGWIEQAYVGWRYREAIRRDSVLAMASILFGSFPICMHSEGGGEGGGDGGSGSGGTGDGGGEGGIGGGSGGGCGGGTKSRIPSQSDAA